MEPLNRRQFFRNTAALAGATWLTPVSQWLARADEKAPHRATANSVIVLWMAGGPSQLETFDPHPNTNIAGGTTAIKTATKDIQLAKGFERLAEEMASVSIIRSMMSKEGDHERGTYALKTGFRPDPTVIYPALGAIACHELAIGKTEIPRHVSILSSQWPARGGYLGDKYDAFLMDDPANPVPDTKSFLPAAQEQKRLESLNILDRAFSRGREKRVDETLHRETIQGALRMMSSEQLKAFDVSSEPRELRTSYGDTPFGRGCLAARRLIQAGVRCVEVTLSGWDSHVNNHTICSNNLKILDPAFSTLIRDLREKGLLEKTMVLCMGEFGRTPVINPAGGRDHWPTGFSLALAGGGIRGGQVIGQTDPEGKHPPADPVKVGDLHATVLSALGIDYKKVNETPIGRTIRFSEGEPIPQLVKS
ncbi:DUF1501 domain-containing protein [Telmatocola sphagniphila]|uniref:DUF1501 domain-containing protein n=1 Tax=Telmatocola sphagniphila TaxID=1123043 RepID=A0A8E6EWY2_9BACT|nr:DUF1501 domain-containing protein [Telmatocola sphagniphila]QVL34282.1 DUF1501 domain-containing protein [Telmatocola sphagniphila]